MLPGRTTTRLNHDRLLVLTPTEGRPSHAQLTRMLAACPSWQQLERFVAQNGSVLEVVHITAAFTSLERFLSGPSGLDGAQGEDDGGGGGGGDGSEGGERAGGGLEGSSSVASPPSGASSSISSSEAAAAAAAAEEAEEGEGFDAPAPIARGSARQRRRLHTLAGRLARLALRRSDSMDGQGLAVALWCLGRIGFSDKRVTNDLLMEAGLRAEQLSAQGLAMVLSAVVGLRLRCGRMSMRFGAAWLANTAGMVLFQKALLPC